MIDLKNLIDFDIDKYISWFKIIMIIIIALYLIIIINNIIKDIKFRKMSKQIDEINKKLDILLKRDMNEGN